MAKKPLSYKPLPLFQTVNQFEEKLKSILVDKYSGVTQGIMPEGYLEAPLAYDAIWAVALGEILSA